MITLSKIYKNYDNLKVLKDVNLHVAKRGDLWLDWEKWCREDNDF